MVIVFPLLSVALLLTSAYFLTAPVSRESTVLTTVTFYIALNAQIVLIAIILSFFYVLDVWEAWLVAQTIILITAGIMWHFFDRPYIRIPPVRPMLQTLRDTLAKHPYLLILLVLVALAYIYGTFLILYYPPNNEDGLAYRLPRVMYWLQYGAMFPWDTPDLRQITFPPNAEIGVMYTFLLAGTDHLAGFVQWLAAIISSVTVYGFGRLLGFDRPKSSATALLYLTLTQVYLQSTSVQNDLVVSAYFSIALYCFFLGIERRHYPTLAVSAIALGLSLGTKFTAPLIIPGFLIVIIIYWLRYPRRDLQLYLSWAVMCAGAFIIFGSFIYVTNTIWYGSPTGSPRLTEGHIDPEFSRDQLLAANMPRYLTDMIDFTSIREPLGRYLHQAKHQTFDEIFEGQPAEEISNLNRWVSRETFFHLPSENRSWFGLTGFLVFLPGLIYGIICSVRDPENRQIWSGLVLLWVVFFLVHSAFQAYTPAKGRYYLLPITSCSVLMIWIFAYNNTIVSLYRILVIILVVATMPTTVLYGIKKPITSLIRDFDRERLRALSPTRDFWWEETREYLEDVDIIALSQERIAWIYPLFGNPGDRIVVPVRGINGPLDFNNVNSIPSVYRDDSTDQEKFSHFVVRTEQRIIPGDYVKLFETNQSIMLYQLSDTMPEQADHYFDFDMPVSTRGWAASRSISGNSVQWMSNTEASIRPFRMATSTNGYVLEFYVPYAINNTVLNSLRVSVNDYQLTLDEVHDNVYQAHIPVDAVTQENRVFSIQFMVDETQSLAEIGITNAPQDTRAIALDWLHVEPIAPDQDQTQ